MNDADRLRIHGPVQSMAADPFVLSLAKDTSSRPPVGPSRLKPAHPELVEGSKGHTRITVAVYSLLAAAVILLILRSF